MSKGALSHVVNIYQLYFVSCLFLGSRLASCSDDGTVKIWQVYLPGNQEGIATPDGTPVWKCVSTIAGMHSRCVYDVAWCHQTGLIATACADDVVRIFQVYMVQSILDLYLKTVLKCFLSHLF